MGSQCTGGLVEDPPTLVVEIVMWGPVGDYTLSQPFYLCILVFFFSSSSFDLQSIVGSLSHCRILPTTPWQRSKIKLLANFTYFWITAIITPDKILIEVCIDLGIGKIIIDRKFLNLLEYSISTNFYTKVQSISGKTTKLTDWATFILYLPKKNIRDSSPILLKIIISN